MVGSTFISIGLHISFIIIAYFGMPSLKIKEPIEQPIDIVDDTPISSQTSLKLGTTKVKNDNNKKIEEVKEKKFPSSYSKELPEIETSGKFIVNIGALMICDSEVAP